LSNLILETMQPNPKYSPHELYTTHVMTVTH